LGEDAHPQGEQHPFRRPAGHERLGHGIEEVGNGHDEKNGRGAQQHGVGALEHSIVDALAHQQRAGQCR
jgi:hypothetical protein